MSRAEERASERYPAIQQYSSDSPVIFEYPDGYYDFKKGYEQAEKDLELTPDDIRNIDLIITDCMNDMKPPRKDFWEEVLKRFNKGRK